MTADDLYWASKMQKKLIRVMREKMPFMVAISNNSVFSSMADWRNVKHWLEQNVGAYKEDWCHGADILPDDLVSFRFRDEVAAIMFS